MNKKEKIEIVSNFVESYKKANEMYENGRHYIHLKVFEPFWCHSDEYCKLVSKVIGDNDDFLEWWVECEFNGQAKKGNKGRMRKIDSVKKFIDFLEA